MAKFLQNHPQVEWVNYPGLESSPYYERVKKYMPAGAGALVTFGIRGGYEAGKTFINSMKLFSLLANILMVWNAAQMQQVLERYANKILPPTVARKTTAGAS